MCTADRSRLLQRQYDKDRDEQQATKLAADRVEQQFEIVPMWLTASRHQGQCFYEVDWGEDSTHPASLTSRDRELTIASIPLCDLPRECNYRNQFV